MIITDGKITECTESELYDYYIKRQLYECGFTFAQYMWSCQLHGTKIVEH